MSPADARRVQIVTEIRRDWEYVRQQLAASVSVEPTTGEPEAALVALSLDHAYQAFESLLVRLERALGLPERTGQHWHSRILEDAGLELPGLRPPVYPSPVAREWDALLRFRHFLRHAYGVPLDPTLLVTNRAHRGKAVAATDSVINRLFQALTD